MKKPKFNLNKQSIVEFFTNHVEKIVFGIFLMIGCLVILNAVTGRDKIDKTPKNLKDNALSAEENLKKPKPLDIAALPYNEYAKRSLANIDPTPYAHTIVWQPPTHSAQGRRPKPEVLAATALRGTGEYGAFSASSKGSATMTLGGNASTDGMRWIVVTGLVPFKKQLSIYKSAFEEAVGYTPNADVPDYQGYVIERLDVTGQKTKEYDWSKAKQMFFDKNRIKDIDDKWSGSYSSGSSDVPAQYMQSSLTEKPGPLQKRTWGASIAHEPEIVLASNVAEIGAEKEKSTPSKEQSKKDGEGKGEFEAIEPGAGGVGAGGGPGGPGGPGGGPMYGGGPGGGPMYGGGPGGPMYGGAGRMAMPGARASLDEVTYYLLRFFDYSVEPGKSYVYRVKLVLKNPNYGKNPLQLEKPEYAADKTLMTSFSEPSPAIRVPFETSVYVAGAKKGSKVTAEPTADVVLARWKKKTGDEIPSIFDNLMRGSVLNFSEREVSMASGEKEKTAFQSNILLLDINGGRTLPGKDRKAFSPAELLLADLDGNLIYQCEWSDAAKVRDLQLLLDVKDTPKSRADGILKSSGGMIGGARATGGGPMLTPGGQGGPGGAPMLGAPMLGGPKGKPGKETDKYNELQGGPKKKPK